MRAFVKTITNCDACGDCVYVLQEVEKHYNEALEENDKLFEETKKLKLENFEQAANLRQSLWKEFSERFSVIQEEHRSVLYMPVFYIPVCSVCLCHSVYVRYNYSRCIRVKF